MIRTLVLLVLLPTLAFAQDFKGYRTTTLDTVMREWDKRTKSEGPGVSFSRPEKIRFVATMSGAPVPCKNNVLAGVLNMMGAGELLKQVSVSHCLALRSSGGKSVMAFVQDTIVPGLNADAKVGGSLEIYADLLAYSVYDDRTKNSPIMLINRFEPK